MGNNKDQKLAGAFVVTGDWNYQSKQLAKKDFEPIDEDSKLEPVKKIELPKRAKIREEGCHFA